MAGKGVPEQLPFNNTLLSNIINASSHVELVILISIFIETQTVKVIICDFELTTGKITEGNLLAWIRLSSFFSVTGCHGMFRYQPLSTPSDPSFHPQATYHPMLIFSVIKRSI